MEVLLFCGDREAAIGEDDDESPDIEDPVESRLVGLVFTTTSTISYCFRKSK